MRYSEFDKASLETNEMSPPKYLGRNYTSTWGVSSLVSNGYFFFERKVTIKKREKKNNQPGSCGWFNLGRRLRPKCHLGW